MDLGTLHLPEQAPVLEKPFSWISVPEHGWFLVGAALLMLLLLPELLALMPSVSGAISRRRGNLEIEHSLSVARSRNYCARMLTVPFLIAVDRYGLYPASFLAPRGEPWLRIAEIAGVFVGFVLLRLLAFGIIFKVWPPRMDNESRTTVRKGLYNYFVVFSVLMLVSVCLLTVFRADDELICLIMWVEMGLLWLLSFLREHQFLASKCSGLGTFLYLCGLEILPVGVLIASALLL